MLNLTLGLDLISPLPGDYVSLSSDGMTVAISRASDNNKAGVTKVHKYDGNSWKQVGKELKGVGPDALLGKSLDLSSDGNVLVVGAPYPSNHDNDGYVQVYYFQDL